MQSKDPARLMIKDTTALWSPVVERLKPYVPGEQCNDPEWVKLNTNESVLGPSARAVEAIQRAAGDGLRMYPDPQALALREAIGRSHGVGIEQVFVGNGSDEVLAHVFCGLLQHTQPVLFPDVTYAFYASYCVLYGITHRCVPLTDDFRIDVASYRVPNGGIVFANPNAPTGRMLALPEIVEILEANRGSVVVVDEAYIDFGGVSAVPLVKHHPNLLVVQTLSKSRALAGLRVGFAIGQAPLIDALERVKNSFNSYPLGSLAMAGAIAAVDDAEHLAQVTAVTIANREELTAGLEALGFEVLPSVANFVFARREGRTGQWLAEGLRERRILVRHFNQPRTADFLRITVGTQAQCRALLAALADMLAA